MDYHIHGSASTFSEFLWANFLRRHLKDKDIACDFDWAIKKALRLA
jgi:hypothetical protein